MAVDRVGARTSPREHGAPGPDSETLLSADPLVQASVVSPVLSRLLVVGGRDRLRFLHAVTTQNVEGLRPGEGAFGALVDDRAHPISEFVLYVLPNVVLVEWPRARAARAREALERLIVADDVMVAWSEGGLVAYESADPDRLREAFAAAAGPPAWTPEPAFFAVRSPGVAWRADAPTAEPEEWTEEELARAPAACGAVLRASRLGGLGVAHVSLAPLEECAAAAGRGSFAALSDVQLDPLQLEAGRPGDAEFERAQVWNELGLMGAVSLTKGCYMGQEVLNRVHVQGKLQRRLVGLTLETPNGLGWAGALLVDASGAPAGEITRAARSHTLERTLALGFARAGSWNPGTVLTARRADGPAARAIVTALPFVTRLGGVDPLVPTWPADRGGPA